MRQLKAILVLNVKLAEDSIFRKAFEALTPGRKRGYAMFFEAAKQAKTRESRMNSIVIVY